MNSTTPESVSTIAAAKLLRVSVQTVQKWVDAGHLTAWKTVGGHRRISARSLEGFMDARMKASGYSESEAEPNQKAPSVVWIHDGSDRGIEWGSEVRANTSGMAWQVSADGLAGILRVARDKPDILIIDLPLGGIDNLTLVQALASDPLLNALKVLLIVDSEADQNSVAGALTDSITIFRRPIDAAAVVRVLEQAFSSNETPLKLQSETRKSA